MAKRQKKPAAEAAMSPETCRRIREALGKTQPEFAELLGVTPVTISLWENGHTPISKGRALAIQRINQGLTVGAIAS